jgi:biotin transport system substrate-specific component
VGRGGRFLETATLATDRAGVRPIALTLVPEGALWRVALVVLGTALLALAARIEIPLPFSPVPVTG